MRAESAAYRYARAVFSIGVEAGEFERIGREMQAIASVTETDATLRSILLNPLYDSTTRREVVTGIVEKKDFSPVTKNFLFLLVDKGRVSLLPEIARSYQELSDEKAGRMKATVVTASKISDSIIAEITASLEKKTGRKVFLSLEVDPSLIGGMIIKVEDIIYDGSIKTQLQAVKDSIRRAA